ncbi:MAG TPA: helix-turn-helix domain-containing protein [Urbifossiella sp.]|nr:helix-turn-helix domain-containing protein [Urbifossiella sp.]
MEHLYFDLVRRFPLRPLRDERDLDAAVAVIDELVDQASLSAPEQDYLEVLSDLVEAYEADTVPVGTVDDASILRFLIENRGETQARVAQKTGISESTISEVLAANRKLNRAQIGKLARYFHIGPGTFAF